MTLNELIAKLEEIKADYRGDILCALRFKETLDLLGEPALITHTSHGEEKPLMIVLEGAGSSYDVVEDSHSTARGRIEQQLESRLADANL